MSQETNQQKQSEKQARFDAIVRASERSDDNAGDEHRRAAAHAHVMTHHALEMDTPEAHEAAAQAHDKVAEMHRASADEAGPDSSERVPGSRQMKGSGQGATTGPTKRPKP